MTYLITGSSGELGRRITKNLINGNNLVSGISRTPQRETKNYVHINLDLLNADFQTILAPSRYEVLIHLAWITDPLTYKDSSDNYNWLIQSKTLIQKFFDNGGKYLAVAGSCSEYLPKDIKPLNENDFAPGTNLYSRYKSELRDWLVIEGFPHLWTRNFYQYGMTEPRGRLIPSLIDSLLLGHDFTINGSKNILDYIFVEDVSNIMKILIDQRYIGIVNIGTGIGKPVRFVAERISEILGRRELIKFKDNSPEGSHIVSDNKKLLNLIGKYEFSSFDYAIKSSIEARKNDLELKP